MLIFALLVLPLAGPLQARAGAGANDQVPLARYAPASANLFIQVGNLGEVDRALRKTHAWKLLPILEGRAGRETSGFDLTRAIKRLIGPSSSINVAELMNAEVAVVADSWSQVAGGLWLIRMPSSRVAQRWFPRDQRTHERNTRSMQSFVTRDGIAVSIRDRVVALTRVATAQRALLSKTRALMAGGSNEPLIQSAAFQKLMAQLPSGRLAVGFVALTPTPERDSLAKPPLVPSFSHAAIGMYQATGRIDFAIRANLSEPQEGASLDEASLRQLLQLPHTTLLAWATTVDLKQAMETAAHASSAGPLGRCLALLRVFTSPDRLESDLFAGVGHNVIVAWDQDLRGKGQTPQVALMVECEDPKAVRDEVRRIAGNILRVLETIDTAEPGSGPKIKREGYFGIDIVEVPLRDYAAQSKYPLAELLASVTPSFAAVDRWFIFALSPEHIRRIIRARNGLSPTLAKSPDVRWSCTRHRGSGSLWVGQPVLAAWVINRWLASFEAGKPSLLDPAWWTAQTKADARKMRRYGIGMKARQQPGVVQVARVYEGTAADGRLQPGDRIVGVDGHLLDLEQPNADLRQRLRRSQEKPGPIFRVDRDDELINVQLEIEPEPPSADQLPVKPAAAARELASLGRALRFASFAVQPANGSHYAARLSLRFVQDRSR